MKQRMRRLDTYLKTKGLSDNYVTLNCDLSSGLLSRARTGSGDISVATCDKILKTFPDLSRQWLITGYGQMLCVANVDDTDDKPIRTLPLVPIDTMAGTLTEDTEGVQLDRCERYQVPDFIDGGAQFLIRVSGDSMIPRYNNGDIVAVRRVEDIQFFQWGKIYVLDTNQGSIIKRVYRDRENERNIICHSENEELYHDFTMPKSAVRGLFVIVGVIHTE